MQLPSKMMSPVMFKDQAKHVKIQQTNLVNTVLNVMVKIIFKQVDHSV